MIEEKLIRFLNDESSYEEKAEVCEWINQPGSEAALEEILRLNWTKDIPLDAGNKAIYKKMLKRIHQATAATTTLPITNTKWPRWMGMAASFLLLLFSSYLLSQMWKSDKPPAEPLSIIEKATAAGEKLTIRLPDQSMVILNSLSTIKFDTDFGKTKRSVHLEGEGYFEVKPDKDRPFVVHTQEVRTTALGTAFNINSRNGQVTVALTEGKVSVAHDEDKLILNPLQMALLDNSNQSILKLSSFDLRQVTAWKEGKITFKSKPLAEVLADLENWYGVEFSIKGNVDLKRKVTGIFDNNNLADVMNGLSFSLNLEYSINTTHVTIQPMRL